ncbi:MAG: antibiotic biosynthesis monooxygenase family protein [Sphingomonas sp.]
MGDRTGQTAVIFLSVRTAADEAGYGKAAAAMEELAAQQPGYCGFESARGPDGLGITLSYWADEASAIAWRDQPDHTAIRDAGRARWYERYEVVVAEVGRSYAWARANDSGGGAAA